MPPSADELEDFKTLINLSQYAAAQGYTLDRRGSSRNSAVMVDTAGDKIIIAKGHDGHWVYFSVHQAADTGGSIIDFVQHRLGLNLGRVRQELRPWLKHASPSSFPTAHPLSNHTPLMLAEHLPPADSYAEDLQPLDRDLLQLRSRVEHSMAIDGHHPYLCGQRKIPLPCSAASGSWGGYVPMSATMCSSPIGTRTGSAATSSRTPDSPGLHPAG